MGLCVGSERTQEEPTTEMQVQTSDQASENNTSTSPFANDVLDLTNTTSQSETAISSNLQLTYVESKSPRQSLQRGNDRRVVFISLHHLNQTYKTIPAHVLSKAIFCFGAREDWLLPTTKSEREAAQRSFLHNKRIDDSLKTIIANKNQEGLVIWLEPKKGSYQHVSDCLIKIDDPATGEKFRPLILDEEWWQRDFNSDMASSPSEANARKSRYGVTGDDVITEINTVTFKYLPTMELLYQSNPTLVPMKNFDASKLTSPRAGGPQDLVSIDEHDADA